MVGLFVSSILASCTKMDHHYKDYVISKTYTGKPDSIWIQPGNERVQISWLIPDDPAAKDVVVYWNNGTDSVKVPLDRTVDTGRLVIDNLDEAEFTFNAYIKDAVGNRSVVMELNTPVYGEIFQSTVRDRAASHTAIFSDSTVIVWNSLQGDTFYGNEIEYTDLTGNLQTIFIPAMETTTTIEDIDNSKTILTKTIYLPEPNALDRFYGEDITVDVAESEKHTLHFTGALWDNAEYVDFNLVRIFNQDDIPEPKADIIDMTHVVGSGSKHNLFTMDSENFGVFTPDFQSLIDQWPINNPGTLTYLGNDAAAQAAYDNLDEKDRDQMIAAFEAAKTAHGTTDRLTLLEEGDILFLHSVDRNLYVAMKVTFVEPDTEMDVELKISRP